MVDITRRAFVPVALIDAQPRVYKSFRGRQLKGLLFGAGGAAVALGLLGLRDFTGYALAFLAALPGFAYGYYQPEGRPVEVWIKILWRFYATSQRISAVRPSHVWYSPPSLLNAIRQRQRTKIKRRERSTHGR